MNTSSVLRRTPAAVLGEIAALRYRSPDLYGASTDYQRFIVLGQARTGSTLVTSSLRKHENIWCFSEVFNPAAIQFHAPGLSNHSPLLRAYRERDPIGFLNRFVFRGYRPKIRAVGFKLFPDQMRLPFVQPHLEAIVGAGDLRFIHIWRANHLRALLSLKLAQQTANWSTKGNGHSPDARVRIDADELVAFSQQRREDETYLRSRFHGPRFLEIEYTELVRDLPGAFAGIQDFLGVERMDVGSPMQKQTKGRLEERIVNCDELRDALAGTEHDAFFDD